MQRRKGNHQSPRGKLPSLVHLVISCATLLFHSFCSRSIIEGKLTLLFCSKDIKVLCACEGRGHQDFFCPHQSLQVLVFIQCMVCTFHELRDDCWHLAEELYNMLQVKRKLRQMDSWYWTLWTTSSINRGGAVPECLYTSHHWSQSCHCLPADSKLRGGVLPCETLSWPSALRKHVQESM